MRLGLSLPLAESGGGPLGPDGLADAARRAEAAGFDSVWAFDAVGRGFLLPDPLIALSVAATATRRVELATGVLQVPLRNPVDLAWRTLTAHLVCGGRLRLGVGAGSTPADFAALGLDFSARFRHLDEGLATMRALWAGGRVGGASLGNVWPAAAGGPPILIGSWAGGKWIARAAREFDGWVASGAKTSWRILGEGIERFRALGGKRAVVTNVAAELDAAAPGPAGNPSPAGPDDPCDLRCGKGEAAERLARLHRMGFDDVVLVSRRTDAGHLAELRSLWR